MSTIPTVKAIIIEDFKLIAEVWMSTLAQEGIETLKIYDNADGIADEVISLAPDLVLMDINLQGSKTGIDLTAEILEKKPEQKVLILTIHTDESYVLKAKAAGACGYLTKNSSISEFKKAVHEILAGRKYFKEAYEVL